MVTCLELCSIDENRRIQAVQQGPALICLNNRKVLDRARRLLLNQEKKLTYEILGGGFYRDIRFRCTGRFYRCLLKAKNKSGVYAALAFQ
jgi:hypothetical protein